MARKPAKSPARMPTAEDRVVVLAGKELFLRTEYTDYLRKVLKAAHGECEFVKFEGEQANPAEVLDECRSFGLMATHKLIVVDDADSFVNANTRPMLERYCEAPSEQATLVLRANTWRPGNLDKLILQHGAIIECGEVDADMAAKWAVRRAEKTHRARLELRCAHMLVERSGKDLGRLDSDLGKLAAAAGEGGAITPQLIAELVGLTREEDAWSLQSLVLAGDAATLLKELRIVMGNSKSDMSVVVSFALTDLARKLAGAAEGLEQRKNPMQIGKELGLWGAAQGAIIDAARRIGPGKARRLFDRAIGVDAGIKSGLDAEIAIETLALEMVTA